MTILTLLSPLAGWLGPLDEVPDPVFAGRMMGDGAAIDPTDGEVRAPFDGTIVSIHRARHAVTLRAPSGAELLIHVGLDTVAMDGEGFIAHVRDGDAVEAGDLLISFDLDLAAQCAKSLICPVVLTNSEAFRLQRRRGDGLVLAGAPLFDILPIAAIALNAFVRTAAVERLTRRVKVGFDHGLHARPAALLASRARAFQSDIGLAADGREANLRSIVAVMSLGVAAGREVELSAAGADADRALADLGDLLAEGVAETDAPVPVSTGPERRSDEPGVLLGVTASPGLAVGPAVQWRPAAVEVAVESRGAAAESEALTQALDQVRTQLAADSAKGGDGGAILAAHLGLLDDPELQGEARRLIDEGLSAGAAWRAALTRQADALRCCGDARIAERAADLFDIERQVLLALGGHTADTGPNLPQGAILLAHDLSPSEVLRLDASRLGGVCTSAGGPTSHMAIIAAARGVPAVVAAGPGVLAVPDGATVILDAGRACLRTLPSTEELASANALAAERRRAARSARAAAAAETRLADGTRIEVFANLGGAAETAEAVDQGAEGCGLLRTEFLFIGRDTPPSEDEQLSVYQQIADALDGRPLIVRTLDIGADKPAPWLPMPAEANPALGLRGVRVSLWRPELLRIQLRAILRVRSPGPCRIMVPMVATAEELAQVRTILEEERAALGARPMELGAMIETPAAAVTADLIATQADFLSVGSNDLAQYAMAMDREHPLLASGQDGLHPAVLRLIGLAADGARRKGRWLGVCGGVASDPTAAPVLVGLGVTELSAAPAAIPLVKAQLRRFTLDQCQVLAIEALAQPTAAAVRRLASRAIAEAAHEGAAA